MRSAHHPLANIFNGTDAKGHVSCIKPVTVFESVAVGVVLRSTIEFKKKK